jgi:hypothetical protein
MLAGSKALGSGGGARATTGGAVSGIDEGGAGGGGTTGGGRSGAHPDAVAESRPSAIAENLRKRPITAGELSRKGRVVE